MTNTDTNTEGADSGDSSPLPCSKPIQDTLWSRVFVEMAYEARRNGDEVLLFSEVNRRVGELANVPVEELRKFIS